MDKTLPIQLYQNGIGHPLLNAFVQYFGIGHEYIVTNDLNFPLETVGEALPTLPILLSQSVLDRKDGILIDQPGIVGDHTIGAIFTHATDFDKALAAYLLR